MDIDFVPQALHVACVGSYVVFKLVRNQARSWCVCVIRRRLVDVND